MKYILTIVVLLGWFFVGYGQRAGYYNDLSGLRGEALKDKLCDRISGHRGWSYSYVKYILKESDADVNVPGNAILVYTGRSQDALSYGVGGDALNREHVWAKSHGDFNHVAPMYSDAHNLKPADASVNQDRSNKDFDNGGAYHNEATGCRYDGDSWEPRDEVKGDIARIIFYMATRYQGRHGEPDLEVVDAVNTYPAPRHGKLSALLSWHRNDPPDEFERNRNEVINYYQNNRNPYIDRPEMVEYIWGEEEWPEVVIDDITMMPQRVYPGDGVTVGCSVEGADAAQVRWGYGREAMNNVLIMNGDGVHYDAMIPAQNNACDIYYAVYAEGCTSGVYHYEVGAAIPVGLTTISAVQGSGDVSPLEGEIVGVTGLVTGALDHGFYIQNGQGIRSGLFIYAPDHEVVPGDEVVVYGTVAEYFGLTELKDITAVDRISRGNVLPHVQLIHAIDAGEDWESVLVGLNGVKCTNTNLSGNNNSWTVSDATGDIFVHNNNRVEITPYFGGIYTITGPLSWQYDDWRIELRFLSDVFHGVGITEEKLMAIKVYPQPAKEEVIISGDFGDDPLDVELYSLSGALLRQIRCSRGEAMIIVDVRDVTGGVYLLRCRGKNWVYAQKIVLFK